ncbi:hypothetical protein [Azohydromonas aeria]|uniref:hypothetical protein n=1 Tax=Azohydromonas aeria TaxID=2590212 RepID=UPI0012FC2C84|nr:hypothetical protein [Azohydromonas aeria]
MHTSDLAGMAVFFAALVIVLGVLWWMLRLNARDLASLERELERSLSSQDPRGTASDG